jgi:tetratricopeptide (TPR) repeat protein
VIGLSLLGGAIATTWQWRQAVAERTRAETQRMTAEQTLAFLVDMSKATDSGVPASKLTMQQLVGRSAARLGDDSRYPPAIRAALQHTLGMVYRNLGDYDHAATLLEAAVAARGTIPGGELELADSLTQLASFDGPKGKPYTSVSLLQRALKIRVQRLGPDDPAVADTLERLAGRIGYEFREAEQDYQRALAIRRRLVGGDDPRLLPALVGLAELYSTTGRFAEADDRIHQALAIRERTVGGDPCDADGDDFLGVFGHLLYIEGYYDAAAHYTDASLDCMERMFGADHVEIADHATQRIGIWRAQGKYAEAEALARAGLELRRAGHGDGSPAVDNALSFLAGVLYERGALDEAMQRARESLAIRERTYGRVHDSVANSLLVIGNIQLAEGHAEPAEASYREAREIWRKTLGEDHPRVAEATVGLAGALVAQGRFSEARSEAEQARDLQQRRLRPRHPAMAATLEVLGRSVEAESPDVAERLFREALAIRRAALPPDHPYIAVTQSLLGECLALEHRGSEAQSLLDHAAQALRARLGDDHFATRRAEQRRQAADSPAATALPRNPTDR